MKKAALLALVSMLLPAVSVAGGDAEKGKAKSAVCAACHGKNGVAMVPIYPNLAGQNQAYLESSLKAYRAKQRQGGQAVVMQAQAASLSDEDITNLSAYYSGLK
ncbi:c-type cytochrome [Spartinivicinus ruber]|uniref:c-type cytochrome n=1 Tax=Spartinivicinus ruber TaxID=2683272 RepID=UPI001E43A35E|nr:cytochrome c [Spartinivicinus ruber]